MQTQENGRAYLAPAFGLGALTPLAGWQAWQGNGRFPLRSSAIALVAGLLFVCDLIF